MIPCDQTPDALPGNPADRSHPAPCGENRHTSSQPSRRITIPAAYNTEGYSEHCWSEASIGLDSRRRPANSPPRAAWIASSAAGPNAQIAGQESVSTGAPPDALRSLLRHLAGTLEDVVGQQVGDEINTAYKAAPEVDRLSREQVSQVLVDLKRHIQGDFYIIEEDDDKIVLGNRACPFGDRVLDRPSLCMMTSNVFGAVAAENLGYAKVELQQTIAPGSKGCRVVVYLQPRPELEALEGREYFKS